MKYLMIILVLFLGGCQYLEAGLATGAKVADGALETAHTHICRVSPVGAIVRRYGATVETRKTYHDFCGIGSFDMFPGEPE